MVQDRAQELERQQQETQAAFEAKLRQVEEETTAAAHRAAETHSFQVQVLVHIFAKIVLSSSARVVGPSAVVFTALLSPVHNEELMVMSIWTQCARVPACLVACPFPTIKPPPCS